MQQHDTGPPAEFLASVTTLWGATAGFERLGGSREVGLKRPLWHTRTGARRGCRCFGKYKPDARNCKSMAKVAVRQVTSHRVLWNR